MEPNTIIATGNTTNDQTVAIVNKTMSDLDRLQNMADLALNLLAPKQNEA